MRGIIVEDGRSDIKTAEILLREFMRGHLDVMALRFGPQTSVSEALEADFAAIRNPEQQAWGMLVAWADEAPLGCVVLQALPDDGVELRRLYVRPQQRRFGIGRHLAASAIAAARMAGAAAVRLNAHAAAAEALALSHSLGFVPVAPYDGNGIPAEHHAEWVFMQLPDSATSLDAQAEPN